MNLRTIVPIRDMRSRFNHFIEKKGESTKSNDERDSRRVIVTKQVDQLVAHPATSLLVVRHLNCFNRLLP